MPTKTKPVTPLVKSISPDVLTALRAIEFEDNVGRIALRLERKVYQATNEVLETLGGKWNKKAKGHVFAELDHDALEAVIESGQFVSASDEKKRLGFFETPDELADRVCELAGFPSQKSMDPALGALEPSAGTGQLLRALERARQKFNFEYHVTAIEIDPERKPALVRALSDAGCDELMGEVIIEDFLAHPAPANHFATFDRILMNPPFGRQQDVDHVLHAWGFLRPGGRLVAITSPGWQFRTNKKSLEFREFVARHGHAEAVPEGTFKESGTMIRSVLLVLDKPQN